MNSVQEAGYNALQLAILFGRSPGVLAVIKRLLQHRDLDLKYAGNKQQLSAIKLLPLSRLKEAEKYEIKGWITNGISIRTLSPAPGPT